MRTRSIAAVAAAALTLVTAPSAFAGEVVNERVEVAPDAAVEIVVNDAIVGTSAKVDLAGDQDPHVFVEEGGEDEHVLCTSNPTAPDEQLCFIPID